MPNHFCTDSVSFRERGANHGRDQWSNLLHLIGIALVAVNRGGFWRLKRFTVLLCKVCAAVLLSLELALVVLLTDKGL